jgi:uncharacterized protein YceK
MSGMRIAKYLKQVSLPGVNFIETLILPWAYFW